MEITSQVPVERVKRDLVLAARGRSIRTKIQAGYYGTSWCQVKLRWLGCGPWARGRIQRKYPGTCIFTFLFLTTAHAPSQSNSLPLSLSRVGSGYRWTRGDGSPCPQLSRSAPLSLSPSSLISGTRVYGGCLTMPFTHFSLAFCK